MPQRFPHAVNEILSPEESHQLMNEIIPPNYDAVGIMTQVLITGEKDAVGYFPVRNHYEVVSSFTDKLRPEHRDAIRRIPFFYLKDYLAGFDGIVTGEAKDYPTLFNPRYGNKKFMETVEHMHHILNHGDLSPSQTRDVEKMLHPAGDMVAYDHAPLKEFTDDDMQTMLVESLYAIVGNRSIAVRKELNARLLVGGYGDNKKTKAQVQALIDGFLKPNES